MKKLFIILSFFTVNIFLFAQNNNFPFKMSYQAVVRDADGKLLLNKRVGVRLSIIADSESGTVLYAETQSPTTNANGLFSLEIGNGNPVDGLLFNNVNWMSGKRYIKSEIDPAGGNDYKLNIVSQLLSVPYAMYALNSGNGLKLPIGNDNETLRSTGSEWLSTSILRTDDNHVMISKSEAFSPNAALEIDGKMTDANILLRNSYTGYDDNADGFEISVLSESYVDKGTACLSNREDKPIMFYTNRVPRMTITGDGKIGIGYRINQPQGTMEIQSNSGILEPHLTLTEAENDYARLMLKNNIQPTKSWTLAGYTNASDEDSKLNLYYFNGSTGKDILSLTGKGKVTYFKTGSAQILPVAYGAINYDGTILSGTGNFTCAYNTANKKYEISIPNEYFNSEPVVIVTPSENVNVYVPTVSRFGTTFSIIMNGLDSKRWQSAFSFVIYLPN